MRSLISPICPHLDKVRCDALGAQRSARVAQHLLAPPGDHDAGAVQPCRGRVAGRLGTSAGMSVAWMGPWQHPTPEGRGRTAGDLQRPCMAGCRLEGAVGFAECGEQQEGKRERGVAVGSEQAT